MILSICQNILESSPTLLFFVLLFFMNTQTHKTSPSFVIFSIFLAQFNIITTSQLKQPTIGQWRFFGPFTVGKTELDADPTRSFGGIETIAQNSSLKMFSSLTEDGFASWQTLKKVSCCFFFLFLFLFFCFFEFFVFLAVSRNSLSLVLLLLFVVVVVCCLLLLLLLLLFVVVVFSSLLFFFWSLFFPKGRSRKR